MSQGKRIDLRYKDEVSAYMQSVKTDMPIKTNYNTMALHETLVEAHNLAALAKKCTAAYFDVDKARAILKAQSALLRKKLQLINFISDCPFNDQISEHTDELPHGLRRSDK